MKKIYLVRHGETPLNVTGVFYGFTDCDLNDRGMDQARQVGESLKEVRFHRVFVSPLIRAKHTAEIILEAANEYDPGVLVEDARLKEVHFGKWEGFTYKELETFDGEALRAFREGWPEVDPPGGECFLSMYCRVGEFMEDLRKALLDSDATDENILIVGHHGSIGLLYVHALGLDVRSYWKFRVDQGVFGVLAFEKEKFVFEKINTI